MANTEHLEKLKQGVDAWNQWRRDNPDIRPDLTGLHVGTLRERQIFFIIYHNGGFRYIDLFNNCWGFIGCGGYPYEMNLDLSAKHFLKFEKYNFDDANVVSDDIRSLFLLSPVNIPVNIKIFGAENV